jgi:hypothetical protein
MRTDGLSTFTATTFVLWRALLTWAAYFLVVYVGVAVACERGFADLRVAGVRFVPLLVGATFAASLILTVWYTLAARRRYRTADSDSARFVGFVSSILGLLALAALAWSTLPPLLLDTGCA